jgi:hypothetical protein
MAREYSDADVAGTLGGGLPSRKPGDYQGRQQHTDLHPSLILLGGVFFSHLLSPVACCFVCSCMWCAVARDATLGQVGAGWFAFYPRVE